MSLQSQLIESFIKGIGKSIAAFTVVGLIGGIYYISSDIKFTKKRNLAEMSTQTDKSIYHECEDDKDVDDDEKSYSLQMEEITNRKSSNKVSINEVDYRKIFNF